MKKKVRITHIASNTTTVWKFQNFSDIRILRDNQFEGSKCEKSVILAILEPLKFDFYEFLHFLYAEIYQINKLQSS